MKSLDGDAPTVLQRSAVARGWLRSLGLGAALASLLTGCAALRPTTSRLTISMHEPLANTSYDSFSPRGRPSTRDCLLVLLPGIGDGPDDFERNGFLRDVAAQASHCEVVLVDAHLMFYLSQTMTERIAVDVLHQARRHGYRSVWLVGISLGGYGAILTARAHPDLVDGVVLIAPMLGVPPREDGVAQEIMDAGGLHRWPGLSPWLPAPRHHFREPRLVWDWLRNATLTRPETLVLAFGEDDHIGARHRLLAGAMHPSRVFAAPGAHEWKTWRRLWNDVLAAQPWAPQNVERRHNRDGHL
jgi:pimeloyl-ACP methyl ester carboxylesterase